MWEFRKDAQRKWYWKEVDDMGRLLRRSAQYFRERIDCVAHAMRGGRDNDPCFGSRMVGDGKLAELLKRRFEIACKRIGFNERHRELDARRFHVPTSSPQLPLF